MMTKSVCESCRWMRAVVTPKGSRFLLCELSVADDRYVKYPPQPVARCEGYTPITHLGARGAESNR